MLLVLFMKEELPMLRTRLKRLGIELRCAGRHQIEGAVFVPLGTTS